MISLATLLRGQTYYLVRAVGHFGLSRLVEGLSVLLVRIGRAFRSAFLVVHLSAPSRRAVPVVTSCAACKGSRDLVSTG
jgi:hypothetical protein